MESLSLQHSSVEPLPPELDDKLDVAQAENEDRKNEGEDQESEQPPEQNPDEEGENREDRNRGSEELDARVKITEMPEAILDAETQMVGTATATATNTTQETQARISKIPEDQAEARYQHRKREVQAQLQLTATAKGTVRRATPRSAVSKEKLLPAERDKQGRSLRQLPRASEAPTRDVELKRRPRPAEKNGSLDPTQRRMLGLVSQANKIQASLQRARKPAVPPAQSQSNPHLKPQQHTDLQMQKQMHAQAPRQGEGEGEGEEEGHVKSQLLSEVPPNRETEGKTDSQFQSYLQPKVTLGTGERDAPEEQSLWQELQEIDAALEKKLSGAALPPPHFQAKGQARGQGQTETQGQVVEMEKRKDGTSDGLMEQTLTHTFDAGKRLTATFGQRSNSEDICLPQGQTNSFSMECVTRSHVGLMNPATLRRLTDQRKNALSQSQMPPSDGNKTKIYDRAQVWLAER
jgi:hypothetical protein